MLVTGRIVGTTPPGRQAPVTRATASRSPGAAHVEQSVTAEGPLVRAPGVGLRFRAGALASTAPALLVPIRHKDEP